MIPENAQKNAKMQILDNSHEYLGNAQNPRKSKISKMLPKSTKMLQNGASSKHFVHYLIKIWVRPSSASKRRRRPSAAAFFWFHIWSNNQQNACWRHHFGAFWCFSEAFCLSWILQILSISRVCMKRVLNLHSCIFRSIFRDHRKLCKSIFLTIFRYVQIHGCSGFGPIQG